MNTPTLRIPDSLPPNVRTALGRFLASAQQVLSEDLYSAVLFGSAAEGALRKSSDVNLLLVLNRYVPQRAKLLRNDLATAEAAILLRVMFLEQDEIPAACEAFAQKFSDIVRRRVLLLGSDPFAGIVVPHAAQVRRLRQVLLNLLLRLREVHAGQVDGSRPALLMMADSTGALRSSAMLLLQLEGRPCTTAKQALLEIAKEVEGGRFEQEIAKLSVLRESAMLQAADAERVMTAMMEVTDAMHARAAALEE